MESHQVVMSKGERKCRLVFLKQLLLFLGWPGVEDPRLGYVARLTTLRELKLKERDGGEKLAAKAEMSWGAYAFKRTPLSLCYRLTDAGWRRANK